MRSWSLRRRAVLGVLVLAVVAGAVTAALIVFGDGGRTSAATRRLSRTPPRGYLRNPKGRLDAQWITALGFDPVDVVADREGLVVEGFHEVAALDAGGRIRWRANVGPAAVRTPALAGDVVAVGAEHEVVGFARESGRVRWRAPVADGVYEMNLVRTRNGPLLVVSGGGGRLVALDPASGAVRWRVALAGGLFTGASGAGEVVVAGWASTSEGPGAIGRVVRLDPATGTVRWSVETMQNASVPVVVGDRVVVGHCSSDAARDGEVIGLDLATGARRWTAFTGGVFHRYAWAAVHRGDVFVPEHGGRVVALDGATGQRGWVSPRYARAFRVTRTLVDGGVVMLTDEDGLVPVLAADGGPLRSRRSAYGPVVGIERAPGDRIVLAVRGPKPHVMAFDRWAFEAAAAGRPR